MSDSAKPLPLQRPELRLAVGPQPGETRLVLLGVLHGPPLQSGLHLTPMDFGKTPGLSPGKTLFRVPFWVPTNMDLLVERQFSKGKSVHFHVSWWEGTQNKTLVNRVDSNLGSRVV